MPVATEGLPDEIATVAASVNALIGRLRGALEAERSFTANSAHELRTPIAAALAQTQRLIAELPGRPPPRSRPFDRDRASHGCRGSPKSSCSSPRRKAVGYSLSHRAPLGPVLRHVIEEVGPSRRLQRSD